jgi:hypothetical protein
MEDVLLVHVTKGVSDTREGVVVPVGSTQASANCEVEALQEKKNLRVIRMYRLQPLHSL